MQVVNGVPLYYHGDGIIEFPDGAAGDQGLETFVGTRITSSSKLDFLAPRRFYTDPTAAHDAAFGYIHLAELAEAGHACAYCHVQHNFNGKPRDQQLDMFHYFTVSGIMGAGKMATQAALFASTTVPIASTNCFVAGTQVQTADGPVPIEKLKLGDRVQADNPQCANEHLASDTVTIGLEFSDPQDPGSVFQIELLRPRAWLDQREAYGGELELGLDDVGMIARARVAYVGPAPSEQQGDGCLVLMTVKHVANELLELRLDTGTGIRVTPLHRFLVEGRGWVFARDLKPGFPLHSEHGSSRVKAVENAFGNQYVFNLEISREHAYYVSADRILVHNQSSFQWSSSAVKNADTALSNGATAVVVRSRGEAEELFLGRYQGDGYRNTTGMAPTEAKAFYSQKSGTYHWDVGDGAYPHGMNHLQVHTHNGAIVRIFFP